MTDDLVQRLRRTYRKEYAPTRSMCGDNSNKPFPFPILATEVPVNPDGHEAADRIETLTAEVERLRDEKDDAISTLDAWFDRRKLGHEAVDQAVLDAAKGYLRVSRNGGMDHEQSDLIEGVIADMARLGMFADLFARAALEKQP
jgi:hypothetical protein